MPKAIKMAEQRLGRFDADAFMFAVETASTIGVLKFLGEVMRVHKIYELPHTKDKQFMQRCRIAYSNRQQALLKEKKDGRGLRQQHVGDHFKERQKGEGHSSRLQGNVRDREQGVLDFGMGEGAKGWVGEFS